MNIIVEKRSNPNEFVKFFDVERISWDMTIEDGKYVNAFVLKTKLGTTMFKESEYKFYLA